MCIIIEWIQLYLPACLASFFVWAIPSNTCPLISTAIVNIGRWDGPVCAISLYSIDGLSSYNNISAFLVNVDELSFVDVNFDLYVADCGNDRIQLFQSGKLSAITIAGNGWLNFTITLNCPTSIVLDGNEQLYIVDSGNNRIIASDGNSFRCIIGCSNSSSPASYQLLNPWSLAFDSCGNVYVSDKGNSRIQKFTRGWNTCGKFSLFWR